mmetsp:Transcript_37104/g.43323  ORF Transcript_37104/g.43323 Transcript_37104/m.43323 type:complete len:93 (+) Transcript_37104:304-582(+)
MEETTRREEDVEDATAGDLFVDDEGLLLSAPPRRGDSWRWLLLLLAGGFEVVEVKRFPSRDSVSVSVGPRRLPAAPAEMEEDNTSSAAASMR